MNNTRFLLKIQKFKFLQNLLIISKKKMVFFFFMVSNDINFLRKQLNKSNIEILSLKNSLLNPMLSKNNKYSENWKNLLKGNLLLIYVKEFKTDSWAFFKDLEKNYSLIMLGGYILNFYFSRQMFYNLWKEIENSKTRNMLFLTNEHILKISLILLQVIYKNCKLINYSERFLLNTLKTVKWQH